MHITNIPQNCDCDLWPPGLLFSLAPTNWCISLQKCFDNRNVVSLKLNMDFFENSRNVCFFLFFFGGGGGGGESTFQTKSHSHDLQ